VTATEIDTTYGPVRGNTTAGISAFRGIPFAASTAGANRFAPPRPPAPWTDVRDATIAGPTAPQNPSMLEQMLGAEDAVVGEDCLSLNVFAPEGATDLPVMVWIHGGGFLTGTGSIPWYDGTNLARRGAVVVTINYRLGVLGFLHLGDIDPAFEGSGNLGILDQVAALEWVRDNVAAFGGDPSRVTIFGESAGAMSVGTLLAVPAADGLFHRAILQSGAAEHVLSRDAATGYARKFLAELGVDPTDLSVLRDLPLAQILEAQGRFTATVPFAEGLPFEPVVDGGVLPGEPGARVAAGCAPTVDLLVGTNTDEMTLFLLMEPELGAFDEAALTLRSDELFVPLGRAAGEGVAVYRGARPDATIHDVVVAVLTDHTFRIPAIHLAESQADHPGRVWMYEFGFKSPAFGGVLGASHALEIPFVWDNLDAQGAAMFAGPPTDATRSLATRLADAWVAFAADGVPAADGLPEWPAYDTDRRATLQVDAERAEVVDDPRGAERRLWG